MHQKIYINSNKSIGEKCLNWASSNTPKGFQIVNNINNCDIFISVKYDKILDSKFLESRRCYNFHPNILPNYAGVGTLTHSILNGEINGGVTLHEIDNGIDTGDIIETIKIKINRSDTAYSLSQKTDEKIYDLFKKRFEDIIFNNYETIKQSELGRKVYKYKDLDKVFDLTTFMKATYFPNKPKPYFFNKNGNKIEISFEEDS
tara:strand:- start:284 stop:892 length:609 start_codon:yes stop_codon:yes gene_type:complete